MASPISVAVVSTRILCADWTAAVGWIVVHDVSSRSLELVDAGHRAARQDAMGDVGGDAGCALGEQRASAALQSVLPDRRYRRSAGSLMVTSLMMFMTSDLPGGRGCLSTIAEDSRGLASARARTTPLTSGDTTMTLEMSGSWP